MGFSMPWDIEKRSYELLEQEESIFLSIAINKTNLEVKESNKNKNQCKEILTCNTQMKN